MKSVKIVLQRNKAANGGHLCRLPTHRFVETVMNPIVWL